MTRTLRTRWCALLAAPVVTVGLAACAGGGGEEPKGAKEITVWSPYNTPPRMAVQEKVAQAFKEKTGITVKVVGMAGPDMNTSIVSGAASGKVPDVALVGPDQVASWGSQGLLDHKSAGEVVEALDKGTFSEKALGLVTLPDGLGAVPSDGWGELLYYRKDVFAKLGIAPPKSVQDVVAAATKISKSESGMAGIVLGTKPADGMARETLEHLGLANGCQMFDGNEVALDSPACVETFDAYQKLAAASVKGDQDVESTRAAYLSGKAAMVIWSPHLLDEIGNLDAAFPVTAKNPDALAENTGVVGALTGSQNSEPTGNGLTINYAILKGAASDSAKKYVEFALSDGYLDTLAMTPEGRSPLRAGTPDDPEKYVKEWGALPLGTDPNNQKPFGKVYGPEVIEQVVTAANGFSRWGFGTGNWATAGDAVTRNTIVADLGQLLPSGDPAAYARHVDEQVSALHAEHK